MPPAKKARGRKVGIPNLNSIENYSIALACLEASEQKQTQAAIDLNAEADAKYAKNLDHVLETEQWPNETTAKGGVFTVEKSKLERTGVFGRWTDVIRPYCLNTITGYYMEFLVCIGAAEKGLPSGTNEDDVVRYVKEKIFESMHTKKKRHQVDLVGGDDDDGEAMDNDATPPVMPQSFDGGPFFLTWYKLGPLGKGRGCENNGSVYFAMPGAKASHSPPAGGTEHGTTDSAERPQSHNGKETVSYAGILKREAEVETYKVELAARKDRIEELKLLITYSVGDAKTAAELELVSLLTSGPPQMPLPKART